METHRVKAHSHKNWRHYLFEFFMLFLAISLGFYVDNLREHYDEVHKERQYMKMMIADLRTDIQVLDSNIAVRGKRESRLQALFYLLGQKDLDKNSNLIYHLIDSTDGYETFNRDDRTIQQLKGAGGMRIISNDSVTAGIIDYDNYIITEIDWNNRTEATRIDNYKQLRYALLDAQVLNRSIRGDSSVSYNFLPHSPAIINTVAGALFQVSRISGTIRENALVAKEKAQNLIDLIQRQYFSKS